MPHRLTPAGVVNVTAMLVAIVGIVIQIVAGVDYPTIPPGPILLAVAVLLLVLVGRFWTQVVAVVVPLFLTVGGLIAPTGRHNLTDAPNTGSFLGTALQLAGIVVALLAGLAVLTARRTERKAA